MWCRNAGVEADARERANCRDVHCRKYPKARKTDARHQSYTVDSQKGIVVMRITTIHIICTQDVPAPRLERLFKRGDKSKLQADQVVRTEAILSRLDVAVGCEGPG